MANDSMSKILVTGACGQIGSELTVALRDRYGSERVLATDIAEPEQAVRKCGPFEFLDVTDFARFRAVVEEHRVDVIYHMAALLSAVGETKPHLAWNVNVNGLRNVFEIARTYDLARVFCPSSIAVFGPETPRVNTPQETIMRPRTMYGITKVTGELLGEYYCRRFGIDVRGIRFPGIISSQTLPGGGTTDYAVEIFYKAVEQGRYTCFLRPDTVLPMMYMPDCIKSILELMETDPAQLQHHTCFNLAAMSFAPADLVAEIQLHMPEFTCEYEPDQRQAIADSWPQSIDDNAARQEWGWQPDYDLAAMTADMLQTLKARHAEGRLYQQ